MSRLLVVDDERVNLDIIEEFLHDSYELQFARDGQEAWERLSAQPEGFDAVILDRIMPRMDGMELLRRIKTETATQTLPVIMQTAACEPTQVAEGLAAGAWYYLAKPYNEAALKSIIGAALMDAREQRELAQLHHEVRGTLGLMHSAVFRFRSPDEARLLAAHVAQLCEDEMLVAMGLSELMLNAVEHGNLGIDYQSKSRLMGNGSLQDEIARRLASPEQLGRWAELELGRHGDALRFTVRDQGEGFNWQDFLEMNPDRAFDSHGRGIALARQLAFPTIEYQGCGNTVSVTTAARGGKGGHPEP